MKVKRAIGLILIELAFLFAFTMALGLGGLVGFAFINMVGIGAWLVFG